MSHLLLVGDDENLGIILGGFTATFNGMLDASHPCVGGEAYRTLQCGSPGCVAPEILARSSYDGKIDIFAAGVVLHTLLVGYGPFIDRETGSIREVLSRNMRCVLDCDSCDDPVWSRVSPCAKDLLKKMLKVGYLSL